MGKALQKICKLGEGRVLKVDQSGINGDKTVLCFARFNEGNIKIIKNQLIEQREGIEELINTNMKELYGVFGMSIV
ncbi:MAG: hypothetical protein RSC24_06330 [Clostridium sp.]